MLYVGSKRRIAKDILPIILKDRRPGQAYVEPFCGGLNSLVMVEKGPRVAGDVVEDLIEFYKALQAGRKFPEFVSEKQYKEIKEGSDLPLKGFVSLTYSFGGVYGSTYRRSPAKGESGSVISGNVQNSLRVGRAALNAVEDARALIKGVEFVCTSYEFLELPKRSIIYCDPPYSGTHDYGLPFDHNHFWLWAEQKKREGHTVFVSEYKAPSFFKCIWSKRINVNVDARVKSHYNTEKLFTL